MKAKDKREEARNEEAKLKAFFEDIAKGRLAAVKRHLETGGDVNVRSKWGWTPLLWAVRDGQIKVVEHLISQGADVNARVSMDSSGEFRSASPIIIAAEKGNVELVKLLINSGADVNARQFESAALDKAVAHRHPDIANLLLDSGAKLFPRMVSFTLGKAKAHHTLDLFKRLVQAGNVDLSKQPTLLQYAAEDGRLDIVQMMVEAGADVNAFIKRDPKWPNWEPMALMRAAWRGHEDVVLYLLKMGADEKVEILKRTARIWANVGKNHRIARLLQNADKLRAEWGVQVKRAKLPVEPKPLKPMSATAAAKVRQRAQSAVPGEVKQFLKLMLDGQPEWALVAVKAPFEAVAKGCSVCWGLQVRTEKLRVAKPLGKHDSVDLNPVVVQVKGHPWVIVFRSLFSLEGDAMHDVEEAARQLSKNLTTQAVSFVGEDTSGAVGCQWFEKGALVEQHESEEGSTGRAVKLFTELGIQVPACYATSDGKEPFLAVVSPSPEAIERADLLLPAPS